MPDYICNCGGVIYRKGQRLICAKCQKDWGGVLYIGLFTDDPDKRGPLTKEVQADGYARQGVPWPKDETWGTFLYEIKGRTVALLPPKPGE